MKRIGREAIVKLVLTTLVLACGMGWAGAVEIAGVVVD